MKMKSPPQVSSLKSDGLSSPTPAVDEGLGLENASFKWNEVEEVKPKDEDVSKTSVVSQTPSPTASSDGDGRGQCR